MEPEAATARQGGLHLGSIHGDDGDAEGAMEGKNVRQWEQGGFFSIMEMDINGRAAEAEAAHRAQMSHVAFVHEQTRRANAVQAQLLETLTSSQ